MKAITLPYGTPGWNEKIRILEESVFSRTAPPFIYNDVLILVASSRMKRTYGRLFLDLAGRRGSSAIVQPEVLTLHQFIQKLSPRLRGPRLMDENSRLVLLEGLVKERLSGSTLFNQSPDLLAPSLAAALAAMIEQLTGAGVTPERLARHIKDAEFGDKPQVTLLRNVYTRYLSELEQRNLTDPAGIRNTLLQRFDPAWLAPYSAIIIDGIHDAGRLEAALLRRVSECGACTWLVDAPSSDLLKRAGDSHPLRVTRDFLAEIGIRPIEGATADAEDLFLGKALFSDASFSEATRDAPTPSSFSKEIHLLSTINMREEASAIAGMVKKSLRRGVSPDSILVAFPALDEYGPLVEELFTDYGIPYNRALGRQLSASPVATAVVSLLRACQEDFSGPSLLRIFSSPFLKFSDDRSIVPALDRLMRTRRIIGGRDKLLAALGRRSRRETGRDTLAGPLTDLFARLGPFCGTGPAPLSLWMERLETLISWSGLGARVTLIKGPLNSNLQAFKKLSDTLASLSLAGTLFPEYVYTFNEWLFLLKKTFMHARFQVPPEDEGGVQILGLEESAGHPWSEIYLGGLVDSRFPRRLPQNIFLPEATLELLGIRTLEKARMTAAYHFYRLLLSAKKVTLTYPENEGDRPATPSPFLVELTPLRIAGLTREASNIQCSLKPEESRSLPELAKAISVWEDAAGLSEIMDAEIDGMAGIRAAVSRRPPGEAPVLIPPAAREYSVTELETYLTCPYDYYVTKVLGLGPLEEASEDISPQDRGSKVHAILRDFYRVWNKPVTAESRAEAAQRLGELAGAAFDGEADTVRNRREKGFFTNIMANRFLDAEEAFWKGGMRPVYLEHKIEAFKLSLPDGTEAEIKAKIDRIDADDDGNFIIVDYKTGDYPRPKMGIEQDIFQLPFYAVMVSQCLAGSGPPLKKPVGLAYYDLKGKTGSGARDVVLFNQDALDDHPAAKPKASSKSAGDFEAILKQSIDNARKAVEGIRSGNFAPPRQKPTRCRYCPNGMMCEQEAPEDSS